MPLPDVQECSVSGVKPITANPDGSYSITIAVNDADRYGNTVDLSQLDFSRYMENPVVLLGHGYDHTLPIGRSLSVCSGPSGILVDFMFALDDDVAAKSENLMQQGILRAASIGWYVESGIPYLAEWSLVSVPLDPDAVARSRAAFDESDDEAVDGIACRLYINSATIHNTITMSDSKCTPQAAPIRSTDNPGNAPAPAEPSVNAPGVDADGAKKERQELELMQADLRKDMATFQSERQAFNVQRLMVRYAALLPADVSYDDEASVLRAACGNEIADDKEYSNDYMRAVADGALANAAKAKAQPKVESHEYQPKVEQARSGFLNVAQISKL